MINGQSFSLPPLPPCIRHSSDSVSKKQVKTVLLDSPPGDFFVNGIHHSVSAFG